MEKISLIIPCYNEEESLPTLYKELRRVTAHMAEYDFEMLFVDDGSKDKTLALLKEIAKRDERVKYISFSRNFGKESAMYAGFCNAAGDYVAALDADMQDPPSLLPKMMKIIKEKGYDSVATRRVMRKGEPKIRSFFARTFYKIMHKISDVDIVDGARDFRLMKREMVDAIVAMCEQDRFSKGIFGWIGFKTYWLPFENVQRVAGKTKWSFSKLFKYSIDGIMAFSDVPLKLPKYLSILSFIASLGMLIWAFVRRLAQNLPFFNWQLITGVILGCTGVILSCMGVACAYLGKINKEVKRRPQYLVRDTNKDDLILK
ncbi:MAG: glycosyltransferase family 2 protein [Clostridia bacterium]|nr:glycosyltransferase family 2 protein [Clostridia bacterium]